MFLPPLQLFQGRLRYPLKGSVAFGYERSYTDTDFHPAGFAFLPRICRPSCSTRRESSAIPVTSSNVSVGKPIMKYSFTASQPAASASSAAENRSDSLTFLLITSRSRWVPASGVKVSPSLSPRLNPFSQTNGKESSRKDGRDRPIPQLPYLAVDHRSKARCSCNRWCSRK